MRRDAGNCFRNLADVLGRVTKFLHHGRNGESLLRGIAADDASLFGIGGDITHCGAHFLGRAGHGGQLVRCHAETFGHRVNIRAGFFGRRRHHAGFVSNLFSAGSDSQGYRSHGFGSRDDGEYTVRDTGDHFTEILTQPQ